MRESGMYPNGVEFDPNAPWNREDVERCKGEHRWDFKGECELAGCGAQKCLQPWCEEEMICTESGYCRQCEISSLKSAIRYELSKPQLGDDLAQYQQELKVWEEGGVVRYE